jgi:hypothetical protein
MAWYLSMCYKIDNIFLGKKMPKMSNPHNLTCFLFGTKWRLPIWRCDHQNIELYMMLTTFKSVKPIFGWCPHHNIAFLSIDKPICSRVGIGATLKISLVLKKLELLQFVMPGPPSISFLFIHGHEVITIRMFIHDNIVTMINHMHVVWVGSSHDYLVPQGFIMM